MLGNNGKGNIPSRDMWQTPQKLWDKLNKQYNFLTDCCADDENRKCDHYYTKEKPFEDFNSFTKISGCWMNPPFSLSFEMFKHFFKVVSGGVAIYRCDNMETKIWQDIILKSADWIFIPKGRICYEGMEGKGSRFPSALIGIGVKPPIGFNGIILNIHKPEVDRCSPLDDKQDGGNGIPPTNKLVGILPKRL